MKKRLGVLMVLSVGLLAGCEEAEIMYDDKLRPVSEVEEIMADKLEVDNPDLDLEVSITEEVED